MGDKKKLIGFLADPEWREVIETYQRCRGLATLSAAMRELVEVALGVYPDTRALGLVPESPLKERLKLLVQERMRYRR